MNKHIIIVLLLIFSSISLGADLNFEEMEYLGGAIILNRIPIHAFQLYRDDDFIFLVLQKEIGRDGKHAVWQVLDHIKIQNYGKDYTFNYVGCELNGKFAPEIAAIAKYQDKERLDKIVKAWKADLKSGKIVEIDSKDVVCINEGYGA